MKLKNIIPAVLFAAIAATPAMACTDWKAIAAFDAIIESGGATMRAEMLKLANDARSDGDRKVVPEIRDILTKHAVDLLSDKKAAQWLRPNPPRATQNNDLDAAIADAKRLLETLNQHVQNLAEDDDERLGPVFAVIDALCDKLAAVERMLES
jgi:hypothetical protein